MDTLEQLVERGRKEGFKNGIMKGKIEGVLEGKQEITLDVIRNMIKLSSLTDEQIASFTRVPVSYVADIRRNYNF